MSRRKGEVTSREIDRSHPHQVEIVVPEGGLGKGLETMHAFCRGRDFHTRSIGRKRIERRQDGMRWCFAAPEHADAFHARFGGERLCTLPR